MKGRLLLLALAAGGVAAAAAQPRLHLARNTPAELTLTWDGSARGSSTPTGSKALGNW